MGNIQNFNFNKLDAFLSNSEYYDFYLGNDSLIYNEPCCDEVEDECLILNFDFNENIYVSGNTYGETIKSLSTWSKAINNGLTLGTFGLTGIDNGYVPFSKIDTDYSNELLVNTLTGTVVTIPSGDTRFTFNSVSGSTTQYIYPKTIVNDETILGDYLTLCGGFYQGYFKLDGYDYEVLPVRSPKAWAAEFWLKPSDMVCSGYTGTTLNEDYPNNKGLFFYMGTRAENKYWNFFDGLNTGCTTECISDSGCTDNVTKYCTITKETDVSIEGDKGYPITLHPPTYKVEEIDNQFLIYGRATKDDNNCGYDDMLGTETVCSYSGDSITITSSTLTEDFVTNPFLIYGRATKDDNNCGYDDEWGTETVCTYDRFDEDISSLELDPNEDIFDNAIGFRITEDGRIGYRSLIKRCGTGETTNSIVTVEESYSESGLIKNDEWQHIVIRFVTPQRYNKCELESKPKRKGRLMFYVNSKLKYVVNDVDELIFKRLNEYKDKQLGVPFNYSLGGGSQGLLESMTFDGQDPDDLNLMIQNNFAGTFIGDISQFKFYNCDLNWCQITDLYEYDKFRYTKIEDVDNPGGPNVGDDEITIYVGKNNNNNINIDSINSFNEHKVDNIVNFTDTLPNINGYIYVLIPSTLSRPDKFVIGDNCDSLPIPFNISPNKIFINQIEYDVYKSFNKTYYNGIFKFCT